MVKACFRCIKKCGSTEVNIFFVGQLIIFAGVPCRPPSRGVRTLVSGRSHPCPGARCWLRPKGAFQKHDIDYMTRFVCENVERFVNLDACGCYYDRSGCYHDGIVSPKDIPLFLQRAALFLFSS